jgi:hypothetical protein
LGAAHRARARTGPGAETSSPGFGSDGTRAGNALGATYPRHGRSRLCKPRRARRAARAADRITGCTGLLLALSAAPSTSAVEEQVIPVNPAATITTATAPQPLAAKPASKAGNEWVIAPIPTLSPSQGFGLQVIGQYIFKEAGQSEDTPSSIAAVGGFLTQEKSWGAFGGYMGHWQDDKWRPAAGGGYADVHYDFYGIGNQLAENDVAVPIDQTAAFAIAQLMRRIVPGLYAGVRLALSQTEASSPGLDQPPLVVPPFTTDVTMVTTGLVAQWDTRDNQFFPTRGQYANASASFHEDDATFQTYEFEWNCYHGLGERVVVAARVYFRATRGDAPFYALSSFGMHNDLRGYKSGKYRDRDMFATQVEYRQKLSERWGWVAFAGVGEVAHSFGDMDADHLLASAGAGLRFRVAKSHPVNLRLDWAYGDESCFYLGVTEAF